MIGDKMNFEALFPVGILMHDVDKKIADDVEELFISRIDQIPKTQDHYGDFTLPERVIDIQKDTPELFQEILNCKNAYHETTGLESTHGIVEFWTQDYRDEGQRHNRHCHGIHGISGVYWIRANEVAQELRFHNPNYLNSYARYSKDTPFSWTSYSFKPTKGTILLFPSYLEHEVDPSPKDTIRTTLAFNFPWMQGIDYNVKY
jgi:hypothetical protein